MVRSFAVFCLLLLPAFAAEPRRWTTVWTASAQAAYPTGNPSAQPNLSFAFPTKQAHDQTFRLIVMPDVWGPQARLRFSNAFGTQPVTFDGVYAGLHWSGGAVSPGTNHAVLFSGKQSLTIGPGASVWSDPVPVPAGHSGQKLAISFHIAGDSGPMTWHAKGLTTSYLTAPGAGSRGRSDDESAFPFTTTSWYFLDAVDMMLPASTKVIVALGDSITDGTASTLNGEDRWPNALARRLHAKYGDKIAVVNAGIGGNQVIGTTAGSQSALERLERDVLSLSGVAAVIWLEGINDFARATNASVEAVEAGFRDGVHRIKAKWPEVRVIGATVVSALGSTSPAHGSAEEDEKRKALNDFIRNSGTFDAVADFDKATLDPQTGGLRPEFIPDSTTGGPGDKLHPNRAGYLAMAQAIDLEILIK